MCPSQSQTKLGNSGLVGALIPSPKAVGLECVPPPPPPSSIPLLLPLQIPCSLVVAKLISNSCDPPPPQSRLREITEPKSLGCCRAWPMLLGWGELKSTNTGELMPIFFLGVDFIVFPAFIFSNFKPPPPILLTRTLLFSEYWADSDMHCNCCAHPPTWELYQSIKRTTKKCKIIVRNEVCLSV